MSDKKHRHYELIIAWANGAKIESKMPDEEEWYPADYPSWYESLQYRIAPPKHIHHDLKCKMNDQDIEHEIQEKGLTAPRITPDDIEANIVKEVYFTAAEGISGHATMTGDFSKTITSEHTLLTFCVLTLRNGFTVTGESACASPENFNAEIGNKIARANAVGKVWPLMGYALKSRLTA